jgi:hypothetical protein
MENLLEMPPAMTPGDAYPTLGGEYDGAQARGDLATRADQNLLPEQKKVSAADIGLTTQDPDKFDWSTDDSVLLGEQFATAVYRNKRGAIVIRQEGVGSDDDHFVILRDPEAVGRLVAALQNEIGGR